MDAESQKFEGVIAGLRSELNPGEPEADAKDYANLLDNPRLFFNVTPPPLGLSYISTKQVEEVATSLRERFSEKFAKKGDYGSGELYETKVDRKSVV